MFRLSMHRFLPISSCARQAFIMRSVRGVQTLPKFQDKVALVTASTDGIGLAIARRLAQEGARVLISSRKQENVDKVVRQLKEEGLNVEGEVCHVGLGKDRENLVNTALQKFGGIDILVSNATAFSSEGTTLDPPEEVWDEILNVNIKAAVFLSRLVVPRMRERGGGSIVFVSSVAAYRHLPGLGPYSVSKTALFGLTKALAPELSPLNIRVNCIAPGIIRTTGSSYVWKNKPVLDDILDRLGVSRMGEPEECAGLVSFLCSSDASYITGENIVVAGGAHSRL